MLTTDIFTPPTSCLQPTYTVSPAGNDVVGKLTAIRGYDSACYPFASAETGFPTMSAVACPLQYSFVAHQTDGRTTLGTCCPTGAHIVSQTAPDLCTRYTGYTSTTVVDATATSVVHNNFFVETAIVVSWTGGEKPQTTSTPSSSTTMTATAARGSVAAAPVVPEPDLGINPERVRQTATTIAVAVGCSIGSVVLIAMILGLITLRRHRKQKAQTQARLDQARLGRAGDEHGPVSTDLPPMYAARQSMETLPGPSTAILKPRQDGGLTVQKILEKTYYNVHGHQPESLDWFNVLIAQTIAQLRADAQEDEAVLGSLTEMLNGGSKPSFIDDIKVTEISLGKEFPIFSNCRVIPVDENGMPLKELTGLKGERLQARMDVDLSDVVTLGIETKLVLNYPKPFVMVLPVALAVSVVRFSGTLSLSFQPSQEIHSAAAESATPVGQPDKNEGHPLNPTGHSPTTLTFTFLDDYRLDLSVHSLIGSRSRLQDVPKIAQLVEDRIHKWFDERVVEPRFQQIVLPSLWPRKKNTRGGEDEAVVDESAGSSKASVPPLNTKTERPHPSIPNDDLPLPKTGFGVGNAETTAEQRTRDWAAQHGGPSVKRTSSLATKAEQEGKKKEDLSEIELAGQEMREADERDRRKQLRRDDSSLRLRTIREASHDGIKAAS
ncbi:Maintenance of mitochondrial morphology protein 1 [Fulvia fulva]|nr:Maintenance of mitochondrial morphology protein 1 [Fulvia fulva]